MLAADTGKMPPHRHPTDVRGVLRMRDTHPFYVMRRATPVQLDDALFAKLLINTLSLKPSMIPPDRDACLVHYFCFLVLLFFFCFFTSGPRQKMKNKQKSNKQTKQNKHTKQNKT